MARYLAAVVLITVFSLPARAQTWNSVWSSSIINSSATAGFMEFEKTPAGKWKSRVYSVDTIKFQVMQSGYSLVPQYTYNFNDAERLAGEQIYALGIDLTGDNITEFYVLAYWGTATVYRQSFKIIDIVRNVTVFEKNDASNYYSYPTFSDLDQNGVLECVFARSEYPYQNRYYLEVYNTGVNGSSEQQGPTEFKLMQNYPNPFNPKTSIAFTLDANTAVQLKIFDVRGQEIAKIDKGQLSAGAYTIEWDGKNNAGLRQPTGVYFYTLEAGTKSETRKMILLQ